MSLGMLSCSRPPHPGSKFKHAKKRYFLIKINTSHIKCLWNVHGRSLKLYRVKTPFKFNSMHLSVKWLLGVHVKLFEAKNFLLVHHPCLKSQPYPTFVPEVQYLFVTFTSAVKFSLTCSRNFEGFCAREPAFISAMQLTSSALSTLSSFKPYLQHSSYAVSKGTEALLMKYCLPHANRNWPAEWAIQEKNTLMVIAKQIFYI